MMHEPNRAFKSRGGGGICPWGYMSYRVFVLGVSVKGVSDQGVYVLGVSVQGVHVRAGGGGGPVTNELQRERWPSQFCELYY